MLDELLSFALTGVSDHSVAETPLPVGLEGAASILDPSAEQRFLTRAVLLNAYLRAGCKPAAGVSPPAGAELDSMPACSPRAADLLQDLVCQNSRELIAEWLAAATRTRQRVPHRLLADLLELARKDKSLRNAVVSVIDQRGRWLIAQNIDWQFPTADSELGESLWETGTPEQRAMLLRQIRHSDPSRARDLLQKTWKDDPADQRVEFLRLFVISLSPADEPMLESALDDRSKQVRAVAADLLCRLPQSQLSQRMIGRVSPLLAFKKGLLKGTKLELRLPETPDKTAERDGIEKAAPQGKGERQWWLQQLLSFVPLSVWTQTSGLAPTDMIAAIAKTDFGDVILQGFTASLERHPDTSWIDPMLRQGLQETGRLSRLLLAALPAPQYLGLAIDVLQHKRAGLVACSDLINNHNFPLDATAARLWIKTVAELAAKSSREDLATLYHLPSQCALRIPPSLRGEIESLWNVEREPWNQNRSGVEKLLKVMEIRELIEKEFPK